MLLRFLGFFLDVSEIMPKFVPVFIPKLHLRALLTRLETLDMYQ